MIDALKRTLVTVRDLTEQPSTPWVLVAGAGGTRYYAVDSWFVKGNTVEFFAEGKPVFVCRVDSSWSVVHRDVIELVTEEEVLRSSKRDADTIEGLHKELHPEAGAATERAHGIYL